MERQLRQVPSSSNYPLGFFDFIVKVGSAGRYQKTCLALWLILWFIAGNLLLGTPFMFYHHQFQCHNQVTSSQCFDHVCAMPPSKRHSYQVQKFFITSIANFNGDDYCKTRFTYQTISSLLYLGCLCGYIALSFLIDNLGRKTSIMTALIITIFGLILTVSTTNLQLIGLGLFLTGFGSDTAVTICFYFISETVEDKLRQRYSIGIQVSFCLGGLGMVLYYYVWGHWRMIHLYLITIPWIICTLVIYFYVQETPMFLFKKQKPEIILNSLNKIGNINQSIPNILTIQQIQSMKIRIIQDQPKKKIVTPIDLFSKPKIRLIAISICLLSFVLHVLYYGPLMLVQSFGFDIFTNAIVLNVSQLISYSISYAFIHQMSRRYFGMGLFGGGLLCAFILIFLKHQKDCSNCLNNYAELVLIFIFRFLISLQFAIFAVNCNQLFPQQIRGLGIGIASAVGAIASTSVPVIFGQLQNTKFPANIIFAIGALIGILINFMLPETKGQQLKQFMEDLEEDNVKKNQKNNFVQEVELQQNSPNLQQQYSQN